MSNSNHTRGFLPLGVSRKRELGPKTGSDGFKRPPKLIRPTTNPAPNPNLAPNKAKSLASLAQAETKPGCSNKLLAGYLATEYFEKQTIMGQKYDPARCGASPVSIKGGGNKAAAAAVPVGVGVRERYAEVAELMKSDGTHLPGIVNPTQLAQWIQM